jgi:hypothetical protein
VPPSGKWLCGLAAIQSAFDQYLAILQSLEEMACGETDNATKANGILDRSVSEGESLSRTEDDS